MTFKRHTSPKKAMFFIGADLPKVSDADLDWFDEAINLLKKNKNHTAADRLTVHRKIVEQHLEYKAVHDAILRSGLPSEKALDAIADYYNGDGGVRRAVKQMIKSDR
jgi:hypothetical protein